LGQSLPGSERISPREPRIAREPPAQMLSQRKDPAQVEGAGRGVPSGAPGRAGHSHDRPPPVAQPPPQPRAGWGRNSGQAVPTPTRDGRMKPR
jgi:hypothetical protein